MSSFTSDDYHGFRNEALDVLVVRSKGQLGNQLFLFAAASRAQLPGERVLFIGFQDLAKSFPLFAQRFLRIPLRRKPLWLWRWSDKMMTKLAGIPTLGRVSLSSDETSFVRRVGRIPVTIFDAGLCQRESLIDVTAVDSIINPQSATSSSHLPSILMDDAVKRIPAKTCFVHVRRGDYLTWPSEDEPAALPDSWYLGAIQEMTERYGDVNFQVVSDDPEYCRNLFGGISTCEVLELGEAESLRLMSTCDLGILSASTFSFWGSSLAFRNSNAFLIAPEFWVGWRDQSWYPQGIKETSFLNWRRVPAESLDQ